METYVKDILKKSDLSVVTKKHVRQKYKDHVGRELTAEEKNEINTLVYDFVRDLAVETQQKSVKEESPRSEGSTGNKENVEAHSKPKKIIIKGQVVDKNDLYKPRKKSSTDTDKVKHSKSTTDKVPDKGGENETLDSLKSLTSRKRREHFKAFREKLKVSDVVKAVFDSYEESSSSISDLTDSDVESSHKGSDSDTHAVKGNNLKVAMERLKEAREKKIQMSLEKKKQRKKAQGDEETKARRSLSLDDSDKQDTGQTSEDKLQERLKMDLAADTKKAVTKKMRRVVIHDTSSESESDLPDISKEKGEKRDKDKVKFKKKKDREEKLKSKHRKTVIASSSDSESDRRKHKENKKATLGKKEGNVKKSAGKGGNNSEERSEVNQGEEEPRRTVVAAVTYEYSDSDDETLDKIAAKGSMKEENGKNENHKSEEVGVNIKSSNKSDNITSAIKDEKPRLDEKNSSKLADIEKYADKPVAKEPVDMEMEFFPNIDTELMATPGSNKRKSLDKGRVQSMEGPTDDELKPTPANQKSTSQNNRSTPNTTPGSTGKESESSTGDTPLAKKFYKRAPNSVPVSSGKESESSTGDTPLAKKFTVNNNSRSGKVTSASKTSPSVINESPVVVKKRMAKKSLNYEESDDGDKDSDEDIVKNSITKSTVHGQTKVIKKRKRRGESDLDSDDVSDNGPRKAAKIESDSEGERSTGDTPLIKKKMSDKTKANTSNTTNDSSSVKKPAKHKQLMNITICTDSESESNNSPVKKKIANKKPKDENNDSDTWNSIEERQRASASKKELDKKCELDKADSDDSIGDTPLIKKKTKLGVKSKKIESEGDLSTDDTPLAKKQGQLKKKQLNEVANNVNLDSDSSSDDEPLARKKFVKRRTSTDSKNSDKSNLSAKSNSTSTKSKAKVAKSRTEQLKKEEVIIISDSTSQDENEKGKSQSSEAMEVGSESESPIKPLKRQKSGLIVSSESETSDEEKMVHTIGSSLDSDWDSDDWDVPLAKIKQLVKKEGDSEAESVMSDAQSSTGKDNKGKKQESNSLRLLRKICRECRLFVRNDRELKDCHTEEQKISKCMALLREAGMKGKPTLQKAEEVKLQKEAAELSAANIISSETGRVMRKVKSIYARRQISPVKPVRSSPKTSVFANLGDLVDSESSPTKAQ